MRKRRKDNYKRETKEQAGKFVFGLFSEKEGKNVKPKPRYRLDSPLVVVQVFPGRWY